MFLREQARVTVLLVRQQGRPRLNVSTLRPEAADQGVGGASAISREVASPVSSQSPTECSENWKPTSWVRWRRLSRMAGTPVAGLERSSRARFRLSAAMSTTGCRNSSNRTREIRIRNGTHVHFSCNPLTIAPPVYSFLSQYPKDVLGRFSRFSPSLIAVNLIYVRATAALLASVKDYREKRGLDFAEPSACHESAGNLQT
jgi:hypothetical protein